MVFPAPRARVLAHRHGDEVIEKPKSRDAYDDVDDAGANRARAEYGGDEVEVKHSHEQPVERAYDGDYGGDDGGYNHDSFSFMLKKYSFLPPKAFSSRLLTIFLAYRTTLIHLSA